MTQSAKGIKSDAITTVISSTISDINTTISNVASNVTTLTSTVSNVASNVSTLTSAVNNVASNISSLTTSVNTVTSGISNVQATVTTIATPKISSITYVGDDTAADPAGGQTITLNGLNFVTGATVLINNQIVSVVSVVNSTTITFTSPALAAGSYIVYVINTDGGTGISIPGIQYSGTPAWTTPAGSLGSQYETEAVNKTLVSAGDAPITYSLVSGSLPPGATFNANGTITGTSELTASPTTYTFTVAASDAQNQETNRQFSITVNPDAITWSNPANATVISSYEYSNISNVPLTATSAIGDTINYSGNNFPSGITISGGNISGMSNTVANTTATIVATGNSTTRTSSETVYFNVQQDVVTWSNPSANTTVTLDGAVYSNTLSATSAAGKSVSYSANALPTGLSLTGNTISGTPTTAGNVTTLLTATAATTNRSATNTINWVINLGDVYWKYTTMLLSGSTPTTPFINDASLNNAQLTVNGETRPSNFNPYNTGYYSTYFNGSSDYLTTAHNASLDFGTADFTVEFWMNTPAWSSGTGGVVGKKASDSTNGWQIYRNSTQPTKMSARLALQNDFYTTSVIETGVWVHWALVRSGSTLYWFKNGVIDATGTSSANISDTSTGMYVGLAQTWSGYANFYMSNLRITNGVALYTSAFTPPTSPLTVLASTALLACQSSRIIDNSTSNIQFSSSGSPSIWSMNPFVPASNTTNLGSAYFDGSGDNIVIPASQSLALGSGDFTIDCWVYISGNQSQSYGHNVAGTYDGASNNGWSIVVNKSSLGHGLDFIIGNNTQLQYNTYLNTNRWYHIAVSRSGTAMKQFIDGIVSGSTTYATADTVVAPLYIGSQGASSCFFPGYISNLRIIKGTALYTANFTPPSTPATPTTNTQLLTLQYNGGTNNNGFVDESSFNNIITRAGNATQGTFSPHSQTGWSNYFDGSSYLAYNWSTGVISTNLTVEGWIYQTATGTNLRVMSYAIDILVNAGKLYWYTLGSTDAVITPNTWIHFAWTLLNGVRTLYINGVSVPLTGTNDGTFTLNGSSVYIGQYTSGTGYGWKGYISNIRVTKAIVYTANFTPPTAPLTAIPNTYMLACQSNRFVDNAPTNYTVTPSGTPSIQAFSPFGGVTSVPASYSNYFDGTGDYLSTVLGAPLDLTSTNPFTIEFWLYMPALPSVLGYVFHTTYAGTSTYCYVSSTGVILFGSSSGGTRSQSNSALSINTWYHVAICRSGGVERMFINGVAQTQTSGQLTHSLGTLYFGTDSSQNYFTNFYLSNFRIVKLTGLYSSNFTPPTAPLTAITNTSLLTCQSAKIVDNSTNNYAITAAGDVKPKAFNPFGNTTTTNVSYTPAVHGGSVYYDGAGDYLTLPASTNYNLTGDFTIEGWVYPTTLLASSWGFIDARVNGATAAAWAIGLDNVSSQYKLNFFTGSGYQGTINIPLNAWTHIALTRTGSALASFVNGVRDYYNASFGTGAISPGTTSPRIGTKDNGIGGYETPGYISGIRFINGTSMYTNSFIPPTAPLTSTPSTKLLLNFTNGGIIDYHSGNNLETVGKTQLASEDPYAGTYYSNYFDGSGDYITLPVSANLAFDGDFTVECWVYLNSVSGLQGVYSSIDNSGDTWAGVYLGFNGTSFLATSYISSADVITHQTTVVAGQWCHIAIVRNGSSTKSYLNGVQSSGTTSGTYSLTQSGGTIGSAYPGTSPLNGYISNLRVVKGTAVYTSGFTPSTAPLTSISGTQLLTCQSNSFKDNSTNNFTLTKAGDTKVKSMNPFQQNIGNSLYFDGTGDYITMPNSPQITLDADFTIEAWIYLNGSSGTQTIVGFGAPGATATYGTAIRINTSRVFSCLFSTDGSSNYVNMNTSVVPVPAGSWRHFAIVRSGSTISLYQNGVFDVSGTLTGKLYTSQYNTIGAVYNSAAGGYTALFNGYIKDLRITKGVARYTTTFTPPAAPLMTK